MILDTRSFRIAVRLAVSLAVAGTSLLGQRGDRRLVPPGSISDQLFSSRAYQADSIEEFTFVRLMYHGGSWGFKYWGTDFPHAERHLMTAVRRLTNIRATATEHPIHIDDPNLFRYPFLYAVEVGQMNLSGEEAGILRNYLLRGGFLVVDDFWGSRQWRNFERQVRKIFPDRPIFDIPMDHQLFHCFYDINRIVQVPAVTRYRRTYEEDGYFPHCLGIADDDGRLMVVINWNTDLGDAWEWVDRPQYPSRFSTPALKLGINMIIYAMSH